MNWKCNIEVHGLENIPKKGPYIVAGNHLRMQSGLVRLVYDAFVISMLVQKHGDERIRWLARPTMAFDIPGVGRKVPIPLRDFSMKVFERKYGALMIDTSLGEQAKHKITEESIAALVNGDVVGIMPEGDIYDVLSKAKKGLYYIAAGYNRNHTQNPVKVVPVAAWGMEKDVVGKKRPVTVHFGKPVVIDEKEDPQEAVDQVMIEIARNLPDKYRGYYKSRI